jgi:hypothetical protein
MSIAQLNEPDDPGSKLVASLRTYYDRLSELLGLHSALVADFDRIRHGELPSVNHVDTKRDGVAARVSARLAWDEVAKQIEPAAKFVELAGISCDEILSLEKHFTSKIMIPDGNVGFLAALNPQLNAKIDTIEQQVRRARVRANIPAPKQGIESIPDDLTALEDWKLRVERIDSASSSYLPDDAADSALIRLRPHYQQFVDDIRSTVESCNAARQLTSDFGETGPFISCTKTLGRRLGVVIGEIRKKRTTPRLVTREVAMWGETTAKIRADQRTAEENDRRRREDARRSHWTKLLTDPAGNDPAAIKEAAKRLREFKGERDLEGRVASIIFSAANCGAFVGGAWKFWRDHTASQPSFFSAMENLTSECPLKFEPKQWVPGLFTKEKQDFFFKLADLIESFAPDAKPTAIMDTVSTARIHEAVSISRHPAPYGDHEEEVLQALRELKAVSRSTRKSLKDLAARALPPGGNPQILWRACSNLRRRGLIETKEGRGGGNWLTPTGQKEAERITNG